MRAARLVAARFAAEAFTGEGAALNGGRWNPPGVAVVYVADSIALAALEILVHVDAAVLNARYVSFELAIPASLIEVFPSSFASLSNSSAARTIGGRWVEDLRSAALSVPSAVVPQERNILLNPAHPDFARILIGEPELFSFDPRLLPLAS